MHGNLICFAAQASIVTLCQKVMPTITAPGLDWIVVGVCKRQISNLMEDLKSEIKRINEGMSSRVEALLLVRGVSITTWVICNC